MNRKNLITIGEAIFSIGFISLLVFVSRTETPGLKNVSSDVVKQTSEPLNKFASLKNEYQEKENKRLAAINKCLLLQNEISYIRYGHEGPWVGLTVRTNNFSVYKFQQYKDENYSIIGSRCWEEGRYQFNKVYKIGGRQIEFFKLFDQCDDNYDRCNPIQIYAYYKEENSLVEKSLVFGVKSNGTLGYTNLNFFYKTIIF